MTLNYICRVQQTAHDLLDRLVFLQSRLIITLIIPLDLMEREFQQCVHADLSGYIMPQNVLIRCIVEEYLTFIIVNIC